LKRWINTTTGKVIIAILLAVTFAAGFVATSWRCTLLADQGHSFIRPEISLDRYIPLVPFFVWFYVLYYPICFTPVLLVRDSTAFRRIAAAFSIEFLSCFFIFYVWPSKMERPTIIGDGISHGLLRLVYSIDPGFNILPSLHVANVVLVSFLFFHYRRLRMWIIVSLAAIFVCLSTLIVKQHYILDVMGGILLAIVSYRLAFLEMPSRNAKTGNPDESRLK
jgi:membrane-associated phospholipid phosphatase